MNQDVKRQIWCLWEPEGTLPPYLRLCFRTIEKNAGVPVELLAPRDVHDLAPDLDPGLAARVARPGQRSDYYRAHLLRAQGGMWLDADTVVIRDLEWAFGGADAAGLACRKNRNGIGTAPLIVARGSTVMDQWIGLQENMIRALNPGEDLPWTALGATTLTQAVGTTQFYELPQQRVAPLPWTDSDIYLSRFARPGPLLAPSVVSVNLYNERFPTWLKQATEEEILKSPIMLARLLRVALGYSTTEEERRSFDRIESVVRPTVRIARQVARSARVKVWRKPASEA